MRSTFQYAGYYLHARSGLNLTATRAYSASFGRFISRDALNAVNRYAYANNSPILFFDPTGLDAAGAIVGGTAGAQIGGALGTVLGGGSGLVAGSPTGGGAILTGAAGAAQGGAIGAGVGAGIGAAIGSRIPLEQIMRDIGRVLHTDKAEPVPDAQGDHTTWTTDDEGNVTTHETWTPNPHNPSGWDSVQHTDIVGDSHYDKPTRTDVPTPHTQWKERGIRRARPADPSECPRGTYNY